MTRDSHSPNSQVRLIMWASHTWVQLLDYWVRILLDQNPRGKSQRVKSTTFSTAQLEMFVSKARVSGNKAFLYL